MSRRTRTYSRPCSVAPGGQHLSPLLLVSYTHRLRAHRPARPLYHSPDTPGSPTSGSNALVAAGARWMRHNEEYRHTLSGGLGKPEQSRSKLCRAGLKGWRAAADAVGRGRVRRAARRSIATMLPCHPFAQEPAAGAAPRPGPRSRLNAAGTPQKLPSNLAQRAQCGPPRARCGCAGAA
jgi:hypothetical protein